MVGEDRAKSAGPGHPGWFHSYRQVRGLWGIEGNRGVRPAVLRTKVSNRARSHREDDTKLVRACKTSRLFTLCRFGGFVKACSPLKSTRHRFGVWVVDPALWS